MVRIRLMADSSENENLIVSYGTRDGEGHQWMEEMNEHIKRQHKGVRMYHLKDTPQSYNVEAGDEDDGKDEGDSDETAPPLAEAPLVAEEAGEPW